MTSPAAALRTMRPVNSYTCVHCGAVFTASDARARYCSNRCQQAAKYSRKNERGEMRKHYAEFLSLRRDEMKHYAEFLSWAELQGLEFPCTAAQFVARAADFAGDDETLINALCNQGIGEGWDD